MTKEELEKLMQESYWKGFEDAGRHLIDIGSSRSKREELSSNKSEIKLKYLDPSEMPKEESGFMVNAAGEVIGYKRVEIMTLAEYEARYVDQ